MEIVGNDNGDNDRDYCEDDKSEDEANPSLFAGGTS